MAKPEDTLVIETTKGRVTVEMRPDVAPKHVARVKELAQAGFYDGIIFHRVIPGFMAQTGDPTGTGTGGSGKGNIMAEFNKKPLRARHAWVRPLAEPQTAPTVSSSSASPTPRPQRSVHRVGRGDRRAWRMSTRSRVGEPPANPTKILTVRVAADAA